MTVSTVNRNNAVSPADASEATITLSLNQLRLAAKSVSRTLDSLSAQIARMGDRVQQSVKDDYLVYDELDVEIRSAITQLIEGGSR